MEHTFCLELKQTQEWAIWKCRFICLMDSASHESCFKWSCAFVMCSVNWNRTDAISGCFVFEFIKQYLYQGELDGKKIDHVGSL